MLGENFWDVREASALNPEANDTEGVPRVTDFHRL